MPETIKQAVIEMIERLPDDASVEDIMAQLYFRQKVDEGLRQLDAGEGVDHEEAKRRLGKWLGQSGDSGQRGSGCHASASGLPILPVETTARLGVQTQSLHHIYSLF